MRPAVLQYLKHGKALCGKVFAGFVETFNHLVSFSANLKGDADLPGAKGGVSVDRSNPDNPILRLVLPKELMNGGEDLPDDPSEDPDDPSEEEESGVVTSVNSEDGALAVIGGEGIEVTTNGKTIKIAYRQGKGEDEDPNAKEDNDCDHDKGGGSAGGVSPDRENVSDGGVGGGGGVSVGGVADGGEKHKGDDDCNCN